eukprot:CAMPEP_0179109568 /NCGR_PEP_ID=MMETSP0796-20121207/51095_1 /TAXON_ID=73915 /ORGANISM="Pyrodinium bahamense, Strain pbaha01" /LENGTH=60 /DNA_ID=CAMNT_0020807679 /DNA_START=112 /DNA_END=291 /DNA_ORIENTATION=+
MVVPSTMPVNHVAPLFPRGGPQDAAGAGAVRDLQVFPHHVREDGSHQELRRTAAVKHHLR